MYKVTQCHIKVERHGARQQIQRELVMISDTIPHVLHDPQKGSYSSYAANSVAKLAK